MYERIEKIAEDKETITYLVTMRHENMELQRKVVKTREELKNGIYTW